MEDVAGAVKELIDAGKVKHFGLVRGGPSTRSGARARGAAGRRAAERVTRSGGASPSKRILPVLEELGIGFVPFQPASARGFF